MSPQPLTLYEYDGCSTCRKARAFLEQKKVNFVRVPIVESPPSAQALAQLIARSGLPTRKWLNTSGQSYRALTARLGKEGVLALTDAQVVALLAADGKLIKRPVLVSGEQVLVGFHEEQYAAI